MSIKVAQLGRAVRELTHEGERTVQKLLGELGTGTAKAPDVRVNGKSVGLDERIPDDSLVTVTPRIVAG